MKLLERLLSRHKKVTQAKTVVPDELVKHYPAPPEKLQSIIQRVPNTGQVLYQYIQRFAISKVTKYWAVDMMEQGLETPGIIQLAGEDLTPQFVEELLIEGRCPAAEGEDLLSSQLIDMLLQEGEGGHTGSVNTAADDDRIIVLQCFDADLVHIDAPETSLLCNPVRIFLCCSVF